MNLHGTIPITFPNIIGINDIQIINDQLIRIRKNFVFSRYIIYDICVTCKCIIYRSRKTCLPFWGKSTFSTRKILQINWLVSNLFLFIARLLRNSKNHLVCDFGLLLNDLKFDWVCNFVLKWNFIKFNFVTRYCAQNPRIWDFFFHSFTLFAKPPDINSVGICSLDLVLGLILSLLTCLQTGLCRLHESTDCIFAFSEVYFSSVVIWNVSWITCQLSIIFGASVISFILFILSDGDNFFPSICVQCSSST